MAVGDAAGAAGLTVYSDSLLVNDVDTALNQRGDDIAADRARLTTLESVAVATPKFFVKRSSGGQNVPANAWLQLTAGAWGTPTKNVGGFTWANGNLTVPRAGVYQVSGHVMFRSNDYGSIGLMVTRNSTVTDYSTTVMHNEWGGQAPDVGSNINTGTNASEYVSLNAGDVLRFYALQRNRGATTVQVGKYTPDCTWNVVWIDNL
jgi:hypothetical protein